MKKILALSVVAVLCAVVTLAGLTDVVDGWIARHYDQAGGYERLACHPRHFVLAQGCVQDRV